MLLFFCKICNDVAALPQDKSWRCCRCSRSAARYRKSRKKARTRGPVRLLFINDFYLTENAKPDYELIEKAVLCHFIPVNDANVLK